MVCHSRLREGFFSHESEMCVHLKLMGLPRHLWSVPNHAPCDSREGKLYHGACSFSGKSSGNGDEERKRRRGKEINCLQIQDITCLTKSPPLIVHSGGGGGGGAAEAKKEEKKEESEEEEDEVGFYSICRGSSPFS